MISYNGNSSLQKQKGKKNFFAFWRGFSKKKEGDKISKIEGGEGQKRGVTKRFFEKIGGGNLPRWALCAAKAKISGHEHPDIRQTELFEILGGSYPLAGIVSPRGDFFYFLYF